MVHRVAVFGGGIAGLTVAHELSRVAAGAVDVTVYERNPVLGGKARSFPKPASAAKGVEGSRPLPGEHGFRFFPGYYRHVIATMRDIPYPAGGANATVADNLVAAPETHFARTTGRVIEMPNQFPSSVEEMAQIFTFGGAADIPFDEACRFARALRDLLCSCDARRLGQFEHRSWFDFVEGDECGPAYRQYLADGMNQRTVAASGRDVSARTVGLTMIRIMTDWLQPGNVIDRVLNGPTSDRWIGPWRDRLAALGVEFEADTSLVELAWNPDDGITSATVKDQTGDREVQADSYVMALPLADAHVVAQRCGLIGVGVGMDGLPDLTDDWMNGLQLYLDGVLDLAFGHTIYVDSEFSLTSISQRQFWPGVEFETFGSGEVKAILSVDISDWEAPCRCCGVRAKDMSRIEVKDHVVLQLEQHLESSYGTSLPNVVDWFLDPAIVELGDAQTSPRLRNLEGLFINRTSSWDSRPTPATGLPNLFLASDYVQTATDLATMEGANEAGREAGRGVLRLAGMSDSVANEIELFDFDEPDVFVPFRKKDEVWYQMMGSPSRDTIGPDLGAPPMVDLPDSW